MLIMPVEAITNICKYRETMKHILDGENENVNKRNISVSRRSSQQTHETRGAADTLSVIYLCLTKCSTNKENNF